MAFSYWRTGTYPANQSSQGTQRNNGYNCYGDYRPTGWGRNGWNKWAWSASCLRTDAISFSMWNPVEIGASLKAWLQGDHIPGAQGANIPTWDDDSGNGNGVSGPNAPDVTSLNLLNAAQFTAANSDGFAWLNTGSFTEGAMFYVAKTTANVTTGLPAGRMGTLASAERYKDGGVEGVLSSNFLSDAGHTTGAVFGDASAWHIAGFLSKTNDWRVRRGGIDVYTTATNTVGSAGFASFLGISEGPVFFDGGLAEIILLNAYPSVTTQQFIEGYLAWKWGLVATLDASHPYKSLPPRSPLVAAVGSYSLTGTATALRVARKTAAAVGSYALTGTTVALASQRRLTGAGGAYTLAGTSASLLAARKLSAGSGAYVITGTSVTLVYTPTAVHYTLVVVPGSYVIAGTNVILTPPVQHWPPYISLTPDLIPAAL